MMKSSENELECRLEAYHYVNSHLEQLESTQGLLHCILGVSLHSLDDAQPQGIEEILDALAARVLEKCPSQQLSARIAHLHDVLFDQEGFSGPEEELEFNPILSYLPAVLSLKCGLPVLLAIVYKAVAERLQLKVEGIGVPGRFLVRVEDEQGWLIVDPYDGGRILHEQEVRTLVVSKFDSSFMLPRTLLPVVTNKQWLMRVIVNLVQVFELMKSQHDIVAMHELLALVENHNN